MPPSEHRHVSNDGPRVEERKGFGSNRIPAFFAAGSKLVLLLLLLQIPILSNPGYFSHDELQWWARSNVSDWMSLPWASWTAFGDFQYRPLTFNLWLVLSYAFAAKPYLMHASIVVIGCANAVLLGGCIERAGATRRTAVLAAIVFSLCPYVAYVHGWVATLADLLTLLMALIALRLLQRMGRQSHRRDVITGVLVVSLTCVALLCKESAVVLPAALLPALYRHPRRGAVFVIITSAAVVVALYLLVRLPIILTTPHESSSYTWAIDHVPRRLAEYLLFPFMPPMLEVGPTLAKSWQRLSVASACVLALMASLSTIGWRWPAAWLASFVALLAPVLILATSYGQYAYLASASAVGIVAVSWTHLRRLPRIALAAVAAIVMAHGVAVMLRMREVGVVQDNFYADLIEQLATASSPLRVTVADESDRWMIERFISNVPSFRGIAIGDRVVVARRADEAAQFVVQKNGHVVPAVRSAQ